jgi:hypothetical protein
MMTHQHQMSHTSAEMQECIDNCTACHAVCLSTMQHCIQMGGAHVEPAHLALMQDCAQICATSADFMLRGSEFHRHTCGVCAEICARCADDCAKFGDDTMMQQCAEACRRCAESCRQMAKMA